MSRYEYDIEKYDREQEDKRIWNYLSSLDYSISSSQKVMSGIEQKDGIILSTEYTKITNNFIDDDTIDIVKIKDLTLNLTELSDNLNDLSVELKTDIRNISSDLNDLSVDVNDLSSDVNDLSVELKTDIRNISSDVKDLSSDLNDLTSDVKDLSVELNEFPKTFIYDSDIEELSGIESDLSVFKITETEYANMLTSGNIADNGVYIINSDYINAYDQVIRNVTMGDTPETKYPGIAATDNYVDSKIKTEFKKYWSSLLEDNPDLTVFTNSELQPDDIDTNNIAKAL